MTGNAITQRPAVLPLRPVRRPAPVRRGPLRLTRRGRALVVLLLLAVLLAAGFALGRVSSSHAAVATTRTAVVQPGDTLWSIAARVSPDRDTRAVIGQIEAVNHLSSASVQVGQRLVLPG